MKYLDIEKEIREAMKELGIERMPTSTELRNNGFSLLECRIGKDGGLKHWAQKLNLPTKERKSKWNKENIKEEVLEAIKFLGIERMPVTSELTDIGRGDLHSAICKNGGYEQWAKELNLNMTECETRFGHKYEEVAADILKEKGYSVVRMSNGAAYDLLVNGSIKVDVKAGKAYMLRGSRCHTFGINKKYSSCDLYVIYAIDENGEIERTFIIPSHELKVTTLSIGANSIYNKYLDRWNYFKVYDEFYKNIG